MSVSAIFGVLLSVFTLSELVAGDPELTIVYTGINITQEPNDYMDSWSIEIINGKKSSLINAKTPIKKDLPENLQIEYVVTMEGADPIEYSSTLCEALEEDIISKSFVATGKPEGEFPTKCPFRAGDWSLEKWETPLGIIPPGVPEGEFSGYLMFMEEGKKLVRIDMEGTLSYV